MTELVLDIERLNPEGHGVGHHRRQTVTVPFTIPGERVRVTAGPSRGQEVSASLVEILRASPHRVAPLCPHFGPCGGCSWQHIAYAEQLRLKTRMVDYLLRSSLKTIPAVRPTMAATPLDDPWRYRQRVHFIFGTVRNGRNQSLLMGHYARGSRRVVPVQQCPVHDARGNAVAFGLFGGYARLATGRERSTLKSVAVRASATTEETAATLVVSAETDKEVRACTRRALKQPWAPSSFHVNVHPRRDAFIFGPDTRHITGPERLREDIAGISFLISPTSFFQTNVKAAEILVLLVLDAVPSDVAVLDLYAGAGLFALPLARRGQHVIAVEENRVAVADGEASRRLSRIAPEQCEFLAERVEVALRRLAPGRLRGLGAFVLDPPREGLGDGVIDALFGRTVPGTVVYVSCNAETLARDLAVIVTHGYHITSIQPVDMFPHTPHIETVATLTRD